MEADAVPVCTCGLSSPVVEINPLPRDTETLAHIKNRDVREIKSQVRETTVPLPQVFIDKNC